MILLKYILPLLFVINCYPQWQLINPKNILFDVADMVIIDGKTICVDKDGNTFISYDQAKTWIKGGVAIPLIRELHFIDSLNGYCYNNSYYEHYYLHTIDGGFSWNKIETPFKVDDLCFLNPQFGLVSNYNELFFTVDKGKTFNKFIHPLLDSIKHISQIFIFNDSTFYILSGQLYLTQDRGKNWIKISYPYPEYYTGGIYRMYSVDSRLYITHYYNNVARSNDGGFTWEPLYSTDNGYDFYNDGVFNKNTGFVVINERWNDDWDKPNNNNSEDEYSLSGSHRGTWYSLLRTIDGGTTWDTLRQFNQKNDFPHPAKKVESYNDSTFLFAGYNALLLLTTDKGNTFNDTNYNLYMNRVIGLRFFDDDNGYIIGDFIHKTTDGGKTFNSDPYPNPYIKGFNRSKAAVLDTNTIIITTDSSGIFKSVDQGESWKFIPIDKPLKDIITDIKFANESVGYLTSSQGIFKTWDKGETWSKINESGYKIAVTDTNHIWLSLNGYIFNSTDGGINWETQDYQSVNYISFADNNYGIAGDNSLCYTTDGGINWYKSTFKDPVDTYEGLHSLIYIKHNERLYGFASFNNLIHSSAYTTYFTIDSGKTWIKDDNLPNSINDYSYAGNTLWATDYTRGFLIKRNDFATLTSVKDNEDIFMNDYSLSQNYPNPFNPSTTIEFTIPKDGLYKVKIYNILGQEITTLINQELKQGIHKTTFDGSKLSSGVYFYQLQGIDVNITKKMVLAK